eukprot:s2518_g7.t1
MLSHAHSRKLSPSDQPPKRSAWIDWCAPLVFDKCVPFAMRLFQMEPAFLLQWKDVVVLVPKLETSSSFSAFLSLSWKAGSQKRYHFDLLRHEKCAHLQ